MVHNNIKKFWETPVHKRQCWRDSADNQKLMAVIFRPSGTALKITSVTFCSRNHCMVSGTLSKNTVCKFSSSLNPQMRVKNLTYKVEFIYKHDPVMLLSFLVPVSLCSEILTFILEKVKRPSSLQYCMWHA